MAQHDYDIADQTAAQLRGDLNDVLAAIVSLNSGPNEPSNTFANMLWYDTDDNLLKMMSDNNDAWISIAYLDQTSDSFRILDDTQVVNTSGTQTGLLGDQSTATWETGTGTVESLVSPAKLKAALDANASGLGVGQTWQDVKSSRSANDTAYQNTTGKPIQVVVSVWKDSNTDNGYFRVSSDGSTYVNVKRLRLRPADSTNPSAEVIVPNNHYYKVGGWSWGTPTVDNWVELR